MAGISMNLWGFALFLENMNAIHYGQNISPNIIEECKT